MNHQNHLEQLRLMQRQLTTMQGQAAMLDRTITQQAEAAEDAEIREFIEAEIASGRMHPADQGAIERRLRSMSGAVEFSEAGTTPRQQLMQQMRAAANPSEVADRRIRAKVAELGGDPSNAADYAEAMTALGYTY